MGETFNISKSYEESLDINIKKSKGIYYTPKIIVDYILNKTIKNHDILKNPTPKILDISCGCGNFLLEAYDILYDLIKKNLYELKGIYGDAYISYDTIHNHIISNCIYGYDIDIEAVNILKQGLLDKEKESPVDKFNIYCEDSLKIKLNNKFDYIIGNPPYIGHKNLDSDYKKYILKEYKQVYKGKSDLYFCFYKKIIDNLNDDGVCSIITPRYFLESTSAKDLRFYIDKNINIVEIVDFLGCEVFKNIGISSCISTLKKEKQSQSTTILRIKNQAIDINQFHSIEELIEDNTFEKLRLYKNTINKEWIIIKEEDKIFYDKIESYCKYSLEDICTSSQGIITGCDKAFVIDKNDEKIDLIDDKFLKSWVKNKEIQKYIIKDNRYKLIYSNDIKNESDNPIIINYFIGKYKERLLNRRECKKKLRLWYELQWGREKSIFERKKIMYPYKSFENRFAIDENNSFSSADVYSFYINKEYEEVFSYEYLVGILNSEVYNKYFKINAKKISKNAYDYYPNKVMKIKIFKDSNYTSIENLSKKVLYRLKNGENNISDLEYKINSLIRSSLDI
nr:N-6 DNA methylase [uncultured Romboutsia sp.]